MRARLVGWGAAALLPAVVFACGLDDSVVLQEGPGGSVDGGGIDGTIIGSSDGGSPVDGNAPVVDGGPAGTDAGPSATPILIYATTMTELYSFEVLSGKLTDIGALTNCGSPTNFADLAMDSTGALYMLKLSDAIYKLDKTGNCTDRSVLSTDPGNIDKISGRNFGSPVIVALNNGNDDFYAIDLSAANVGTVIKLNPDIFPDQTLQFGLYDLACNKTGACWTALAEGCSPGATSSCLYTFPDDGGVVANGLGAIGVQPAGLAYALNTLFAFGADGKIAKIPLGVSPLAAIITPTGAAEPLSWTGAASASNN